MAKAQKPKTPQSEEDTYLYDLKSKFSRAQDLCEPARLRAQTWQDYYDGYQWDQNELDTLAKRKQPALTFNHIKPAVNATIGIVDRGKTDPKAYGRTPEDSDAADVVTDCLRYIADVNRWQSIKSLALKDFLISGLCIGIVEIDADKEIKIVQGKPEAFFYDPYSRMNDFSDARYLGLANWTDEQDVIDRYPDKAREIADAVSSNGVFETESYLDRPRDSWAWADNKSRRVMLIEMHHKVKGDWHKCVFVSGVILEQGPSGYKDDRGRPLCPLIAMSAYVDRDNRRYGIVQDMMGPQDAINKGRSKAIHLLNVNKLRVDPSVGDVDGIRAEYAKPDGIIEAREGMIEQLSGHELLPAHIEMMRDAKAEMQRQSPSPGIVGRQGASQSGRAILAEQQAGMTEQAPLLGRFDDWTLRIYRSMWYAVKQFWDAPKYIRITDDEDAPKYIMMNEPALQMDPNNPGHPVVGPDGKPVIDPTKPPRNQPAKMDVDVIIDSTPDVANLAQEQFQRLTELIQAGVAIPPDALIEASSLPRKRQIIDKMKEAQQNAAQQPNPAAQAAEAEQAKAQVQLQAKQAQTQMDAQAHAEELQRQDQADQAKTQRQQALEQQKFENSMQLLQAQAQIDGVKLQQSLEADAVKQRNAIEIEAQRKQLDLHHASQQKEMDFAFKVREAEHQDARQAMNAQATEAAETPKQERADAHMSALGKGLEAIGRGHEALAAAMVKPKTIQRGPDGKALGIQ